MISVREVNVLQMLDIYALQWTRGVCLRSHDKFYLIENGTFKSFMHTLAPVMLR